MNKALMDVLTAARKAIIAGDSASAMKHIDAFVRSASKTGIDKESRAGVKVRILELRDLAEASQRGADKARSQIQAIILAAQSLQTYDNTGQRQMTSTTAAPPRRY